MKSKLLSFIFILISTLASAQCAMCTKTAASLDDNSARGLNTGIIYLAFMPLTFIIFIGYKWWKSNRETI
jgi:hypothetical protein